MRARWRWVLAIALAAWLPAEPARAWGSYTHGLIAARAYDQLVPQHPWLAAQREAFLWGALAPDMAGCRDAHGQSLAHTAGTLASLWRDGAGAPQTRAFVLGWAVHLAADEVEDRALASRLDNFRAALAQAGGEAPPSAIGPLADWAADAALARVSDGTLQAMFRAAAAQYGTPESEPVRKMLGRVLAVDETAYLGFVRHQAAMSAGSFDRYLGARAQSLQLEPWTAPLRDPAVRLALGDLMPLVTLSVKRGVTRAEALLGEAADASLP